MHTFVQVIILIYGRPVPAPSLGPSPITPAPVRATPTSERVIRRQQGAELRESSVSEMNSRGGRGRGYPQISQLAVQVGQEARELGTLVF